MRNSYFSLSCNLIMLIFEDLLTDAGGALNNASRFFDRHEVQAGDQYRLLLDRELVAAPEMYNNDN